MFNNYLFLSQLCSQWYVNTWQNIISKEHTYRLHIYKLNNHLKQLAQWVLNQNIFPHKIWNQAIKSYLDKYENVFINNIQNTNVPIDVNCIKQINWRLEDGCTQPTNLDIALLAYPTKKKEIKESKSILNYLFHISSKMNLCQKPY